MNIITIEDIVNDLKNLVDNHPQIQSFGFGNIDNINTKNYKYPLLWMQLSPSTFNNNHEIIKADLYIADVLEQNLSNEVRVFTNTSIYANDIIGYLLDDVNDQGYNINSTGIVKEPFSAKFDHHLNGYIFELEFMTGVGYCTEDTPITE